MNKLFYIFIGFFITGCGVVFNPYQSETDRQRGSQTSAIVDSDGFGVYLDPEESEDNTHNLYLCQNVSGDNALEWKNCFPFVVIDKRFLGKNKQDTIETITMLASSYRSEILQEMDYDDIGDSTDISDRYSNVTERIGSSKDFIAPSATVVAGQHFLKLGLHNTENLSKLNKNGFRWQQWKVKIPKIPGVKFLHNKHLSLNFLTKILSNIKLRNQIFFFANNKVIKWGAYAALAISSVIFGYSLYEKNRLLYQASDGLAPIYEEVYGLSQKDQVPIYQHVKHALGGTKEIVEVEDVTRIPWNLHFAFLSFDSEQLDEMLNSESFEEQLEN